MSIEQNRLDAARRVFLAVNREHDGREFWDFRDEAWLHDEEIEYKRQVRDGARRVLSLDDWERLDAGGNGICELVTAAFGQAGNLVLRRWGDVGYRGWSQPADEHRAELGHLTRLMMTAGDTPEDVVDHFDRLCQFLKQHRMPCQWPAMSYLLFLRDSKRFFPVHPGLFQDLLDFLGVDATLRGTVSGDGLSVLLGVADEIREHLEASGYVPRDAIDVQSFMWVVATNLGAPQPEPIIGPVAEPDWDRERERRNRASRQQQTTGLKGEVFVYDRERARLREAGRGDLADRVEVVSITMADGGYDIRSYETDGTEIHLEVKTTTRSLSAGLTVFLSARERERAESDPQWRLCLVHDRGHELLVICEGPVNDDERFVWRAGGWELDIAAGALLQREESP